MSENLEPALTAPGASLRAWCVKLAEPASIIALLAMAGTCGNWWNTRSADSVHLEDRVQVMERKADDLGNLSNRIASLGTRLESVYDLLKLIRDDQQHQNDAVNHRLDYLQQQSGHAR